MFDDVGHRRRQPHRDASRSGSGRPARPDRCRNGPLRRLPPDRHGRGQARRRARRPDDPVPRDRGSLCHGWRHGGPRHPVLDASTATANPAVTLRSVGSNGGQAAAFTYDLAKSVVYTRQGNPAWAGQERDGQPPPILRSDDMFYPDWIDFSKVQIPQADEQQRLLANLIEHVNRDRMPLPRFWYFPRGEKAVVVMTGDDHAAGGTAGQFDWATSVSPAGCNVDDWECVRQTSYIYPNTRAQRRGRCGLRGAGLRGQRARQHQLRGLDAGQPRRASTPTSSPAFASSIPERPRAGDPPHPLHRLERLGDPAAGRARQRHPPRHELLLLAGRLGPGPARLVHRLRHADALRRPRRIADRRLPGGDADDRRERPERTPTHINTLLDNAIGAPGYYGVVTTNMHTDSGTHAGQQTVVNAALAKGVPVVSARQMLTWLDGRNGSSFANLAWNAGTLTFSIARGAGSNGLQAMLPTQGANGTLQTLTRGGEPGHLHRPRRSRASSTRSSTPRPAPTRRRTTSIRPAPAISSVVGRARRRRHGHDHLDDRRAGDLARRLRHERRQPHLAGRVTAR